MRAEDDRGDAATVLRLASRASVGVWLPGRSPDPAAGAGFGQTRFAQCQRRSFAAIEVAGERSAVAIDVEVDRTRARDRDSAHCAPD